VAEERKFLLLFAATILAARKLAELESDAGRRPIYGTPSPNESLAGSERIVGNTETGISSPRHSAPSEYRNQFPFHGDPFRYLPRRSRNV